MKIKLNFFDIAYSRVMDVPESTGFRWDMALTQPLQAKIQGSRIPEFPELRTVCSFEWDGHYGGGEERGVRIYRLVDIRK